MASKFRANIGLNQQQLDKLADKFPEINDAQQFPSVTVVIQYIFEKVLSGELVERRFQSMQQDKELDIKLKNLKIIDLQVKIQKSLIHDLKISPSQTLQVIKNDLEINETDSQFAKLEPNLDAPTEPETETDGINEMGYCSSCKHLHNDTAPRRCQKADCNCGVRG